MNRSFLLSGGLGEGRSVMSRPLSSLREIQCRRPRFQLTSTPPYVLENGLISSSISPALGCRIERNLLPQATFTGARPHGRANGARLLLGCRDFPFATALRIAVHHLT